MSNSNKISNDLGAVVLSGGHSLRMGFAKSKLPVSGTTMLEHIVHNISKSVSCIAIANGSKVIQGPKGGSWTNVPDRLIDCGPLEGIRVGLEFLAPSFEFAFVTACDTPVFNRAVVEALLGEIGDHEAAMPVELDRVFGLTAVYRTEVHHKIGEMIDRGKRRVSELSKELDSLLIPSEALKRFDPELGFLKNINTPTDYFQYLESIGDVCDPEFKRRL